jgi:predicted DCC family thiol-disulfide oxidoreductase YuxK
MPDDAQPAGCFVYDADCGICTRASNALVNHWDSERFGIVSYQALGDEGCRALGFSTAEAQRAAFWVTPDAPPKRGHEAVAAALEACGGWRRTMGLVVDAPIIRWFAARVYRLVAENRHRLPGPDACTVPAPTSSDDPTRQR